MPIACAWVMLKAIEEFNNVLMWLVRAMFGIWLEWVKGLGLRLVLLPHCLRYKESAMMFDFQKVGF